MIMSVFIAVSMIIAVIVAVTIVMAVPMSIAIAVSMSIATVIVVVLAVMIAVIVPVFHVGPRSPELPVPANVPAPVGMFSSHRQRSTIAEVRIEVVIYISAEANRSTKPWTGANKYAAREPLRTVIAKRRARIRSVVEIPVRAYRSRSNPDRDVDLCL